MSTEAARAVTDGVYLVDAEYLRSNLVASYLVVGGEGVAVVETGHVHAVPRILAAIDGLRIPREDVRHVIVTHVHLDHAGGAGALMRALPKATLIAHPRGARHMIDPKKLWAGTEAVYGVEATRTMYGEPIAIAAERVVEAPDGFRVDLGERPLTFLDAPGHAKHHFVVHDERRRGFFTGDSFGLSYRETDSAMGPFFCPTTTPVQLEPEALHRTYDRILSFSPERVFLTHFGMVEGELRRAGESLHRQLEGLVRRAKEAAPGPGRHAALKAALAEDLWASLQAHGAPMTREEALAFFENDLELNTQGLGVWLDAAK